ncbi:uncharacterized protein F4822DRAFT_433334 [Hypoxylon trugodes]|uniref:uncharacterized protein n=1 Tax=Hypoxylon trugodes TaxID=326681 RepID=UPI00219DC094|nr:uncharacterized protein F4822DRAFT_433334 [Hypoxylon trugodes]KAI1384794.1 hypothetical protein F4822DRAFT_433334 [Hypoxylon trugodes]
MENDCIVRWIFMMPFIWGITHLFVLFYSTLSCPYIQVFFSSDELVMLADSIPGSNPHGDQTRLEFVGGARGGLTMNDAANPPRKSTRIDLRKTPCLSAGNALGVRSTISRPSEPMDFSPYAVAIQPEILGSATCFGRRQAVWPGRRVSYVSHIRTSRTKLLRINAHLMLKMPLLWLGTSELRAG